MNFYTKCHKGVHLALKQVTVFRHKTAIFDGKLLFFLLHFQIDDLLISDKHMCSVLNILVDTYGHKLESGKYRISKDGISTILEFEI